MEADKPAVRRSSFETADFRTLSTVLRPSFDLVAGITTSRKTADALVSVRAAIIAGANTAPFLAEARKRFEEQAAAMGAKIEWVA